MLAEWSDMIASAWMEGRDHEREYRGKERRPIAEELYGMYVRRKEPDVLM